MGWGGPGGARAALMVEALRESAHLGKRHLGNFAGESQLALHGGRGRSDFREGQKDRGRGWGAEAKEGDGFKKEGSVGQISMQRGHME